MRRCERVCVTIIAALLAALCVGCAGGSTSPVQATSAVTTPPYTGAISITPASMLLGPGQVAQFEAIGTSGTSEAVTWSVNGVVGGSSATGTISSNGIYTAPEATSATLVTVQAALTANPTSTASASVATMLPGTVSTTNNPQVALYSLGVPSGSTVTVQFGTDTTYGLETSAQMAPSGSGQVNILVAGMRASTTYHMRAVAQLPNGIQYDDPDQMFTTGALPAAQIPNMTATTTPGMTPNSGIEMLDLLYFAPNIPTAQTVLATDLSGNVIWYFNGANLSLVPDPVKLLPNGDILINYDVAGADGTGSLMEEVDLAGDVVWQMTGADLNAALAAAGYNLTIVGTHHDVAILPNGHLIVIASEQRNFTNLTGYPGTTTVTGDVLIDLDTNRKPVWTWDEFDYLDVNRHPMSFPDWTHTNAVLYSTSDGDLVISIRHQYWVIKIDYNNGQGSGDIVWKLGWQGDFTLEGGTDPVDWFYAQHGPSFVTTNTSGDFQMVLFDNGDNRPINGTACGDAPTSPCYSRVPLFDINESAKTATILWKDTLSMFSYFGGNAEVLGNGNVEFDECASEGASQAASVYEVTQSSTSPQTVWQLQITGQNAYRAMRVPSLYPGVQW